MRKTKTVLIVGGSGFIGTHLTLRLRSKYKVFSTFNRRPQYVSGVTPIPLDVSEKDYCKRVVYTVHPNVVIYVVGNNDPEYAENNNRYAELTHAAGPVNILTPAEIFKPRVIYLSNCYVFDGMRGNYTESDTVITANYLGKVKVSAENFVRGKSLNHVIIRSSPVFGRGNANHFSFMDQIRVKLERKERAEVSPREVHSFAPVYGLVDLVERLVEGGPRNKAIHYGGLTKMNTLQFCRLFARRYGYDESLVTEPTQAKTMSNINLKNFRLDFSLNSSEAVRALKINALLLEKGFDLLNEELAAGF